MRAIAVSFVSALLWGLVASACHEPNPANVGSEPNLSSDVCAINEALGKSPVDYVTALSIYENGRNSKTPTLAAVATAQYPSKRWQVAADFFGDDVWMDTLIRAALAGTPPFTTEQKRVQMVKKLLQGSVLTQQTAYHLDEAIEMAESDDASGALVSWDRAMAAYYGADVDCAPFGNGQARGIEFATTRRGVAATNDLVARAFKDGADILEGTIDTEELRALETEILRNIDIIYIQSILKYAKLVDESIEDGTDFEKFQAEGYAYAHAVLPVIDGVDEKVAQKIIDTFEFTGTPTESQAENVAVILAGVYSKLGVKNSEVRNFNGDRKNLFVPPRNPACTGKNPFAGFVQVGQTAVDR